MAINAVIIGSDYLDGYNGDANAPLNVQKSNSYYVDYPLPSSDALSDCDVQPDMYEDDGRGSLSSPVEKISSFVLEKADHIMTLGLILKMVGAIVFVGFCAVVFIKAGDGITRAAITPFLLAGICVLLAVIMSIVCSASNIAIKKLRINPAFSEDEIELSTRRLKKLQTVCAKLELVFGKGYIIAFFLYWFGLLIVADYLIITEKVAVGGSKVFMLCFTLIFWIVGIFALIRSLKPGRGKKTRKTKNMRF